MVLFELFLQEYILFLSEGLLKRKLLTLHAVHSLVFLLFSKCLRELLFFAEQDLLGFSDLALHLI